MSDLISVIIPVYNMSKFLRKCLDSVIGQTYQNLEIIIIDDGSTDDSGKICDEYAVLDQRIHVVHQENQGLVMSRKKGLALASGRYVGFVDSDDWIDADMYEYLYRKLLAYNAQIVTSGRFIETRVSKEIPDNVEKGCYHPMQDVYFCKHMIFGENKLIWGITPNFWNKLFEKELLTKWEERVDPEITYGEDDACVYPCMAFANSVYVTNRCFYHYRLRKTSMSNSSDDKYFIRINLLYLALKSAFENHPQSAILMKELGAYMFEFALRGINGLWGIQSDIRIPRHWFDVGGIVQGKRIMLYGAGFVGKDYYTQFCLMGMKDQIVWVDKNGKALREQGYPVSTITEIDIEKIDRILIAIYDIQIVSEVIEELKAIGVDEKKIDWKKPRKILEQKVPV